MRKLNVSLVEDHAALRDILVEYIGSLPQVERCAAVRSAEQALEAIPENTPDLMFIDLSLPGMSGIELIRELRKLYPGLKCAILSGHKSQSHVRQALAAGASAYILKGEAGEIERGLDAMLDGRTYVSQGVDGRR